MIKYIQNGVFEQVNAIYLLTNAKSTFLLTMNTSEMFCLKHALLMCQNQNREQYIHIPQHEKEKYWKRRNLNDSKELQMWYNTHLIISPDIHLKEDSDNIKFHSTGVPQKHSELPWTHQTAPYPIASCAPNNLNVIAQDASCSGTNHERPLQR